MQVNWTWLNCFATKVANKTITVSSSKRRLKTLSRSGPHPTNPTTSVYSFPTFAWLGVCSCSFAGEMHGVLFLFLGGVTVLGIFTSIWRQNNRSCLVKIARHNFQWPSHGRGCPSGHFREANIARGHHGMSWMDGWMVGWLDGWMVGWLDGWMVGWLDGWMVGWMDGWMDGGVCWIFWMMKSLEDHVTFTRMTSLM